jgi:hypothetical protein
MMHNYRNSVLYGERHLDVLLDLTGHEMALPAPTPPGSRMTGENSASEVTAASGRRVGAPPHFTPYRACAARNPHTATATSRSASGKLE